MTPSWTLIRCPYCDEAFETAVDASCHEVQRYIEDCAICCRPISLVVEADETGDVRVQALRDDDPGG